MFPKNIKTKSGEGLIIREVIATDASTLIEYVNKVVGESNFLTLGVGDFNKTVEEEEKIIEDHSSAKNRIFLVAEINGNVVGLLNVNASNKPRIEHIGDFGVTVLKDHWGKGIGSSLIEAMLDWAKSTEIIRKINLNVQANNEAAIALYKKYGFEIEGIIRRDSFIDGKFYDSYAMGILIN